MNAKHAHPATPTTAPDGVVAAYEASIATYPAVRIPVRLAGFKYGWQAAQLYGVHLPAAQRPERYESLRREYDGSLRMEGLLVARRRSAVSGFTDGWNAAMALVTGE